MFYLRVGDDYARYEGPDEDPKSWEVTLVPKEQASSWSSRFEIRVAEREVRILLKLAGNLTGVVIEGEAGG